MPAPWSRRPRDGPPSVPSADPGVAGENRVWAPEWFLDTDGLHILVAVSADGGTTLGLYEMHPTDPVGLTTWSSGTILAWGANTPSDPIDPFVVKTESTYLFYGRNAAHRVKYSTAAALTGSYAVQGSGDWAGWGAVEGPSIVEVDSNTWRIYLDLMAGGTDGIDRMPEGSGLDVLHEIRKHRPGTTDGSVSAFLRTCCADLQLSHRADETQKPLRVAGRPDPGWDESGPGASSEGRTAQTVSACHSAVPLAEENSEPVDWWNR